MLLSLFNGVTFRLNAPMCWGKGAFWFQKHFKYIFVTDQFVNVTTFSNNPFLLCMGIKKAAFKSSHNDFREQNVTILKNLHDLLTYVKQKLCPYKTLLFYYPFLTSLFEKSHQQKKNPINFPLSLALCL